MLDSFLLNSNITALIIDDSPESLGMLNTALNEAGITALLAIDSKQALSIAKKMQPDVILLDAIMPNIDGFETCILLKQILPTTPVIFMTGLTDVQHTVKALKVGAVDYVTKPLRTDEVLARIKVHVTNAQLTKSAQFALDISGQYIFSASNNGEILWATPQAQTFIESAKEEQSYLEEEICQALKNWLDKDNLKQDHMLNSFHQKVKLSYICEEASDKHLLRLIESDDNKSIEKILDKLKLTTREAEVLLWLSKGKTNREIAQILELSHRTINTHLENIFRKLGVDNRTAAARMCLQVFTNEV